MSDDDLVVLRTFPSSFDAELAKSALDAANIESMLRADNAGGMYPPIGGVELIVRAEDALKADEILMTTAAPAETRAGTQGS